ncbi:type II and III secretion system protein [Spiribacter salinus M19-40]|jgi:Flp pilus assembly secretin CpaC|uniref:Type II and III secretion system protein n=1 Tax=Spiribacter salinus M19-40 TaxID=1260251 RepID=R4V739_9GAMM|nr:pilus assembly protein N-terminal domain-containing protein [Spiribacter salinus]AGM40825.1 type II and III secretion system protein [Spiribacter salinus M19-40]
MTFRHLQTALPLMLCLFLMTHPVTSAGTDPEAIRIEVGHSAILAVPGIKRVAIASSRIAEVEVVEPADELVIFARRAGTTDLRVWRDNGSSGRYRIHVRAPAQSVPSEQIEHLAYRVDGVRLERFNEEYLLTGQPTNETAQRRLKALTEAYPMVRDFTDASAPPAVDTVRLQARFVELSQSSLRQIGFNWNNRSPAISFAYASDLYTNDVFRGGLGDFLPDGQLPLDIGQSNTYLGVGASLSAMIDLLGEQGEAQVIAEPMLSTLSGASAEFQAGGEVPIPIQGDDGATTVSFRDYGILLRVEPFVTADREIQTRVEVEVSNVDESISVLGIPGFAVRNAATEMRGRSGETLLIAGLIDGQQSEAVSQLPGLGDLPILGTLFKSRRFQRDETELVVLITPYIEGETDTPTASKASLTKPSNPRPSDNSDSRLPLEGFPP